MKDEDSTDSEAEREGELLDNSQQIQNNEIEVINSNNMIQCWGMLQCKADNRQIFLMHRVQNGVKDCYTLGRHSSCDVQVSDRRVSAQHCSIYCDYEESRLRVFLQDSSVNGSFVNDSLTRLRRRERIQLRSGDDVYLVSPRLQTREDAAAAFLFVNMRERLMIQRAVALAPCGGGTNNTSAGVVRHVEDDYIIGDEIGKGMSGVVYLCTHRASGLQCAVKIIDTKRFGPAPGLSPSELRAEAQIMKTLNHCNIIKIYDTYETNNVIYIVMELVRGGDLFDSIITKGKYTEIEAKIVMKQIFSAVQYLHNTDIIHRDLKPENILLMDNNQNNNQNYEINNQQIRITDFGLAKKTTQEGLKTFCGTPQYFAPEVLRRRNSVTGAGRYGKAADMWSLGVILYILLSGTFPFDEDALFDQIASAQYNVDGIEWYHISKDAKNLIKQLMTLYPHDRLNINQALQHSWFNLDNNKDIINCITNNIIKTENNIGFKKNFLSINSDNKTKLKIDDKRYTTNNNIIVSSNLNTSKKIKSIDHNINVNNNNNNVNNVDIKNNTSDSYTPMKRKLNLVDNINNNNFDFTNFNLSTCSSSQRPVFGSLFNSANKSHTATAIQASLLKSTIQLNHIYNNMINNNTNNNNNSNNSVLSPIKELNNTVDINRNDFNILSHDICTTPLLLLKKKNIKNDINNKIKNNKKQPYINKKLTQQKLNLNSFQNIQNNLSNPILQIETINIDMVNNNNNNNNVEVIHNNIKTNINLNKSLSKNNSINSNNQNKKNTIKMKTIEEMFAK